MAFVGLSIFDAFKYFVLKFSIDLYMLFTFLDLSEELSQPSCTENMGNSMEKFLCSIFRFDNYLVSKTLFTKVIVL